MENNSKKSSQIIRHYTDVDALYKILGKGLRFSKPSEKWQDKNDVWALTQYQKLRGNDKDVYILCFCDGIGNIHHWDAFGKKDKIKCSIKIDKVKFTEYLHKKGYQLVRVEYPIIKRIPTDYVTNIVENLPYLKRSEYSVEHELRIVAECDHNNSPAPLRVRDFVQGITLCCDPDTTYAEIKQKLIHDFKFTNKQITNSGVLNGSKWQNTIKQLLSPKEI